MSSPNVYSRSFSFWRFLGRGRPQYPPGPHVLGADVTQTTAAPDVTGKSLLDLYSTNKYLLQTSL